MVMALDLFRFFQFLKASSYTLAFQSPKHNKDVFLTWEDSSKTSGRWS